MPETTTQTVQNLFPTTATWLADATLANSPLAGGLAGADMSQTDKDAILRQIHPIFLTTHSEEKAPVQQSNFDKFLSFLRLCLEWLLKLVDILVDAAIQIARLFVWVVAILGVLIVVTLMTNTTDKFIDLLNSSIFPIVGIKTTIQKVWPTTPVISFPTANEVKNNVGSSVLPNIQQTETTLPDQKVEEQSSEVQSATEVSRQELLRARRARTATTEPAITE